MSVKLTTFPNSKVFQSYATPFFSKRNYRFAFGPSPFFDGPLTPKRMSSYSSTFNDTLLNLRDSNPATRGDSKEPATQAKSHSHSKEKVDQNESSNDASNETSDCENGSTPDKNSYQKPLTKKNLSAQNQEQGDSLKTSVSDGSARGNISSTITSPPVDEEANKNSLTAAVTPSNDLDDKQALPKKFFCKVCNQGFTRKHNMVSHELIHTTIKLHNCESCNLSFRRIHDLNRHKKLHTGEKPYHCVNCDRKFARPDALTRHLNSPHACSGMNTKAANQMSVDSVIDASAGTSENQTLKESDSLEGRDNHRILSEKLGSLPPAGKQFNAEQLLPLASGSSSASVLPTSKQASSSDQDSSGTGSNGNSDQTKTRAKVPNYNASSSTSGDSNDSIHVRPSFELNRWRPQQLHNLTESSVGTSDKTIITTTATTVSTADDGKSPYVAKEKPFQQLSYPLPEQMHQDAFRYGEQASGNQATEGFAMGRVMSTPGPYPGPPGVPYGHDNKQGNPGMFSNESNEVSTDAHGNDSRTYERKRASFDPSFELYAPRAPPPHFMPNYSLRQNSPPGSYPNEQGNMMRTFFPIMPAQDRWQGMYPGQPQHQGQFFDQMPRVGQDSGSNHRGSVEHKPEQIPEFVRLEAYHELLHYTNTLQARVSVLEERLETMEAELKRDKRSSAKMMKRMERKEKKRSKKVSTKS